MFSKCCIFLSLFVSRIACETLRKEGGLGAEFGNYCFYEGTLQVKKNVAINIEEALSKAYPYVESL